MALCPSFLAAMNMLGKRWNGLIINVLGTGPLHFVDLRRSVAGITDAVLARRIEELLVCQLIERESASPRSAYQLTEKGIDLLPILHSLTSWGEKWDIASQQSQTHQKNTEPPLP